VRHAAGRTLHYARCLRTVGIVRIEWNVLWALIGAGAVWVSVLCVITLMSSLAVIAGAVAYVLLFAVALASRRIPTGLALFVAWATAVVAAGAFMHVVGQEPGAVIFLGGVLGTFLAAAWMVPGFFLLLLIDPTVRKIAN
jgi:hypothetical protein